MWTWINCEQNNDDELSCCPLCGAEKPVKRETPAYDGARAQSAPAPNPANASRPAGATGGAWGNVGAWRRASPPPVAPRQTVVQPPVAPRQAAVQPPVAPRQAVVQPPGAPRQAAVQQPVVYAKASAYPPPSEALRKEKRKLRWLRAALLLLGEAIIMGAVFVGDPDSTRDGLLYLCSGVPVLLLAYKSAGFLKAERWLSLFFNSCELLLTAAMLVDFYGTDKFWLALLLAALILIRVYCHWTAMQCAKQVIALER